MSEYFDIKETMSHKKREGYYNRRLSEMVTSDMKDRKGSKICLMREI